MISHEKKLIFIHIPKTGGKAFSEFLRPYCDEESLFWSPFQEGGHLHAPLVDYYLYYGFKHIADYKIVTICRNPWDKALSTYMEEARDDDFVFDKEKFKRLLLWPHMFQREPHSHLYFWQTRRIADLTMLARHGYFHRESPHLQRFLKDGWFYDPDHIISFENFATEAAAFFDLYGIKYDPQALLKKVNTSRHDHYTAYYDEEDIELIGSVCDIDTIPGVCNPHGYVFDYDRHPTIVKPSGGVYRRVCDPQETGRETKLPFALEPNSAKDNGTEED